MIEFFPNKNSTKIVRFCGINSLYLARNGKKGHENKRKIGFPFHKLFLLLETQLHVLALKQVSGGDDVSLVVKDCVELNVSVNRKLRSN